MTPPRTGDLAPDFALLNQDGQTVRLSDYRGRRVILFAYPKENSLGCNMQACGFRDEFELITARNAVVFAIGDGSPAALKAWKDGKKLPYDVLSDPDHAMLKAWGAFGIDVLGLIKIPIIQRAYWAIDENGRILDARVPVGPGESVKRALQSLDFDMVKGSTITG